MNTQSIPASVSLVTTDGGLRVDFFWEHDRFVHRVSGNDAVIRTHRGELDDDWPDAPPLQQLSLETIDGGEVILGVGSAGRSHWSVSVRTVETDHGQGLKFEWACRHKTRPRFLGTTYQREGETRIESLKLSLDTKSQIKRPSESIGMIEPVNVSEFGTDCWSYTFALESE